MSVYLDSGESFAEEDFDFIICGGGTAGLVVAARLSENANVKVGVLEAGANLVGDPLVETPAVLFSLFHNEKYDWIIKTTPQEGNKNAVHHMPRGKLLGGSSAINFMMYVRGSTEDYENWSAITKDAIWGSKNMNKYFRKYEAMDPIPDDCTDRSTFPFVSEFHGTSGPIHTSFNETKTDVEDGFLKAFAETTGYIKVPRDPWSGDHIGFFNSLGTVMRQGPDRGKRSYSALGYIEPNKNRPNLKILCGAHVIKVIMDGDRATGTSFLHGGKAYTAMTKREVIVCSGSIMTPQILELSGIGDPEILKGAGVECKVINPSVGANLRDHIMAPMVYELQPGYMSGDILSDPEILSGALKELEEKKGGPLTAIASLQGFIPYKNIVTPEELATTIKAIKETEAKTGLEKKQLEIVIRQLQSPTSANIQLLMIPASGNPESVSDQSIMFPPRPMPIQHGITPLVCLQYPSSRGTVHIASSNPTQHPTVDPGYLRHPADKAILAAGLRLFDKIIKNSHVKDMVGKRVTPPSDVDFQDIKQCEKAVEDLVLGQYHANGSCAMGGGPLIRGSE